MTPTERTLLAAGALLAGLTAASSAASSGVAPGRRILLASAGLLVALLVVMGWMIGERRHRAGRRRPSEQPEPSGGREAILGAVAEAAERFLRDGEQSIPAVLEQLGRATGASRVYVWENHQGEDGSLLTSQRYEWAAPDVDSQIDNPKLQELPYVAAGLERWTHRLGAGMTVQGLVRDFPRTERAILGPQRVLSLVAVPIFVGDEWWGFIGVDDCVQERVWSVGEIGALRVAAGALGGAIHRARAMELLEQAEAKYRAIVEKIPAAIFLDALDGKATTLWVSSQIKEILGFPPEEWIADPDLWMRQMHPDDRERVKAATERHNKTLEPFAQEYRIFHRDGRMIWVRDEAMVTYDDDGKPRFSQGFFMDITERKRAEVQERRHAEYLSAIHETALGLMDRLEVDGLLQAIVGRAAELLGTGHGFVYLPDETGERMEMKVGVGALTEWMGLKIAPGEGAAGTVWERGEPLVVGDYAGWGSRLEVGLDVASVVAVPLGSRNEVVGVLGLAHIDPDVSFTKEDVEQLATLAEFASIALDNARLYEAAQRQLAERKRAQAELEEQEERFRTLANSALEGICIHDRGKILEVNRAFAEMFRFSAEELVGTQVLDLVAPEDREMAARRIDEQTEAVGQHEALRSDGSRFTVEIVGRRIPYRGRQARVVALQDITERRRAEEELRLVHSLTLAMVEAEALDAALDVVVRDVCRATGWAVGEAWIPVPDGSALEPTEAWYSQAPGLERFREATKRVRVQPEEELAGKAWSMKAPVWIRNIAEQPGFSRAEVASAAGLGAAAAIPVLAGVEVAAVLVFFVLEPQAEDERLVKLISGVAAQLGSLVLRKRAEEALRSAEEKYRGIFEQAAEGIFRSTPEGLFESVNPALATMLGYASSDELLVEVPGIADLDVDPARRQEGLRLLRSDGSLEGFEYEVRRSDGRTIWVSENARLVREEDGDVRGVEGTLLDITQRRQAEESLREAYEREREAAEQLRNVDEMKNAFLTAVSHELRTPLSSILGFSLTLDRGDLDLPRAELREMIGRIAANARKLEALLADLLDLDRISRGILEATRRRTDIGALVHRVVEGADLGDRPLLVEAQSIVVHVDGPKVERIVENLVANAAKYTPPGTPVWVRLLSKRGGVMIVVEDAGPGVEPEQREAIFRPFTQGEDVPSHAPGTGIGLSLVARFAEMHGGSAWVEDRKGGGASFRVFLPTVEVEAPDLPQPAGLPGSSGRSSR